MQAKPEKTSGQKKGKRGTKFEGGYGTGPAVNLVPKGRLLEMKSRVLSCTPKESTFHGRD